MTRNFRHHEYRGAWGAVGLLLLLVTGCGKPAFLGAANGEFPLAEKAVRPEAVKDFRTLFNTHCQGCHGPNGRDGAAVPLNDPLFLALIPEAELRRVIAEGRKDTLMPAFARSTGGPLTDEQVGILVRNMHDPGSDNDWTIADVKGAPDYRLDDALARGSKRGDADDGAAVFEMNCASCHGDKGQGDKAGPVNDRAFLALVSDQALRRVVITGRPDLGMPDYKTRQYKNFTPLTNQDVADVVAYLGTWRNSDAAYNREPQGSGKRR